jgi:signal transduction histidine kinase/sensor domain CHASE-containing protein
LNLFFSENLYVSLCCEDARLLSLRKKTLLIITITLAGLIILLYASSRSILLQSFVLLENDDVYLNTERGLQAISNEVAAMTATAQDWATRRDSAAFVQSVNPTYIETYLDDSTLIANNLNIVAFTDASGRLVYEQNFDLVTGQERGTATGIAQHLQPGSPLLNLTGDSTAGGVLLLPAGPALVAAVPVTPGSQSPAVGVLILGRYLNQDEIQRMADAAQLILSIYYFQEPRLPPDVMNARAHLSEQKRFFIQTIDAHNITGYSLLNDIYGSPALILRVSLSRRVYEQGQAGIWYFVLALVASGLVFSIMIMILLEQTVLSRLAKLNAGVNQIRNSHNLALRVPASGRDEIAQLGHAVNEMLAELKQSEEAERKQRQTAEVLRHTAETMAASIQLEDTFRLIVEQLKLVIPYDRALIVMAENEKLRIVESSAFAGHERLTGQTYADGDVPVFDAGLQSTGPIVVEDVRQAARTINLPGFESWTGTWVSAPLLTHAVPMGLLCLARDQPRAYAPPDLEALTAFAQQAALAVENAYILTQLETSLFDLREAQARLARTARLSAAGEIAAGVAHQINNPLTTVIAEVHLLGMGIKPDDPQRESVDAIQQAAERAGSVVQRLLDLTRVHDYVMEPLDINESLKNSIALVRAQIEPHLTRLDVRLDSRLPLVNASRQHLEDVWLNLLLNARDALNTSENGMIRVTSAYDATARVIRVTVQDNGPGIAPDHLKNIFEPFFTTKDYGTGLGLAICRDVVIRHSGQISVDSIQGQGTTFTITLPRGSTTGSE